MFRLVLTILLSLLAGLASAAELKGKVIGVADKQVRISVDGDFLPHVGDEVAISYQIPDGPTLPVGTWKVSKVEGDVVEATLVTATGIPTVDQIATINSPDPTRRSPTTASSPKPESAPQPTRARLRYQGKIYDTVYERGTVQGRPLDYYFFDTPAAGAVPAVLNGNKLRNYFERDPAADYQDQSKVEWRLIIFVYRNRQWELDHYSDVAVEILERYEEPARKP